MKLNFKTSSPILILCALVVLCLFSPSARAQGFTDMTVPYPDPPKVEQKGVVQARADGVRGARGGRRDVAELVVPTAYVRSRETGVWSTGDSKIDRLVSESGLRNGVDPYLIYCVMNQESTFKPMAISPKGARGLMQLMPGTAARFGVRNIYDPAENIEGGAKYLRYLFDIFGDDRVDLVLASYNAGEGATMKFGWAVPPYSETQEYVRRIAGRYGSLTHRRPTVVKRVAGTGEESAGNSAVRAAAGVVGTQQN